MTSLRIWNRTWFRSNIWRICNSRVSNDLVQSSITILFFHHCHFYGRWFLWGFSWVSGWSSAWSDWWTSLKFFNSWTHISHDIWHSLLSWCWSHLILIRIFKSLSSGSSDWRTNFMFRWVVIFLCLRLVLPIWFIKVMRLIIFFDIPIRAVIPTFILSFIGMWRSFLWRPILEWEFRLLSIPLRHLQISVVEFGRWLLLPSVICYCGWNIESSVHGRLSSRWWFVNGLRSL